MSIGRSTKAIDDDCAAAAELSWEVDALHPSRNQFLDSAWALFEAVLPADSTSWNAVDVRSGETEVFMSPGEPDWGGEAANLLAEVAVDHPMVASYLGPRGGRSAVPRRMSDVVSRSELRRTRAYADLLGPIGAEFQLTILTDRPTRSGGRCWTLNRSGRDFSEDERDLAVRLQPVLIALDAACQQVGGPTIPDPKAVDRAGLTPREVQVLGLVGRGLTAVAIGRVLRISANTVRKHLQNAYGKLDTHDRLLAVSRARALGVLPPA